MSSREGNTLGIVMRDAWDGKKLQVMARSNKDVCQSPHISVIGNITSEELRLMKDTDKANGFANRFMFVCVKRSKKLPHGGHVDAERLRQLAGAQTERQIGRELNVFKGVLTRRSAVCCGG